MGSLIFHDTVPDINSVVAERVRDSGAVLLGKTNTPEFGLQGITENRLGDACRNPWNTEHTPGGFPSRRSASTDLRWRIQRPPLPSKDVPGCSHFEVGGSCRPSRLRWQQGAV